ncbi:MAG TPA: hypothetical protein VGK00_02105 [Anaerolineales bacterium]|jgi:hypothetical protein
MYRLKDAAQVPALKKIATFVLFGCAVLLLAYPVQFLIKLDGTDWVDVFYKVAQVTWQGGNPYTVFGFYNPPWSLPLILALSIGSARYSQALVFVVSLFSAIILCRKMNVGILGTAAYLLSAPSLIILTMGNLEHILMLALLLPLEWGALIFMLKPQIGLGYILYHAWLSYRQAGWLGLLRLVSPLTATIMTASLLMFGFPRMVVSSMPWNLGLFPYLLLPAVLVLVLAVKSQKPEYSLAASPGFAPYLTTNSFLTVGVALMKAPARWMVLYSILSWVFQIIFYLNHT